MDFSIIVPVYNSGKTLGELHKRIVEVMTRNGYGYEVIFVNDCSVDDSLLVLKSISELDRKVSVLAMGHNAGQNIATLCGIEQAKFDTIITMDDDMQYSPDDIPKFTAVFNTEKYIIIYGEPLIMSNDVKYKKLPTMARWLFDYFFLRSHNAVQYFKSFRMFSKSKMKKVMPKGLNVYYVWDMPADQMTQIKISHNTSMRGPSNYNIKKLIRFFAVYIYFALMKSCGALVLMSISLLTLGAMMTVVRIQVANCFFKSFFCVFIVSIIFYFLFKLLLEKRRTIVFDYHKI